MPAAYIRNGRIDVSRVGQRAVLYHRDTREALVLNPTASWLWDQLEPSSTVEQLALALQQHYRLPPDQATHDVNQFLDDLRRHGAIAAS
jgi:coenzyme PQQ synthesis protein D (PqqD)